MGNGGISKIEGLNRRIRQAGFYAGLIVVEIFSRKNQLNYQINVEVKLYSLS